VRRIVSAQTLSAIARRHRLTLLERQSFQFSGSTLIRWRIPDRRSVASVVRELESDSAVASVQPNYLYTLQQAGSEVASEGDPMQYELAKLHLPQAHTLAKDDNVLVAAVDTEYPYRCIACLKTGLGVTAKSICDSPGIRPRQHLCTNSHI
jgi:hypothetical protein